MGNDLRCAAAAAALLVLTACAGTTDTQSAANDVTRAVYDDNVDGVLAHADDALSKQISRTSVGVVSDKMHALGDYKGLTLLATDSSQHEYTYRASFSKGTMNVIVRVDADGKLAAYRLYPV
jgi:hypothetical protein